MTILNNLPHVVWVQKYSKVLDPDTGLYNETKDGHPIPVRAYVEAARSWSEAEEYQQHGLQLKSLRICYARRWPGDVNSHVFFEGDEFLTKGDAPNPSSSQNFGRGRLRRVAHVRITLYRFGRDEEGISL